MSGALRIVLPWPLTYLWPNKHTRHPLFRAAQVKQARYWAKLAAVDARNKRDWQAPEKARLTITVRTNKRGRLPDPSNAESACKAYLDGCTDAGIWIDDDMAHLEIQPVRLERAGVSEIQFDVEALHG